MPSASLPLFSIIIPAYNQVQYLCQSVESALVQTYPHYEIIVVDDGSTDQTAVIAKSFKTQIRYIHQKNTGLAGARNTGIRAAKGNFIAFLDSDDIWLPEYLEAIQKLISQHPEASLFYCCAQCIDNEGEKLPQQVGAPISGIKNKQDLYQALLRSNFLIPSTITIRRDVILNAGGFDQSLRYCEDIDLWLRIAKNHVFTGTDSCQVLYRIHNASLSTNPKETQKTKLHIIEKIFGPDDGNWARWSADKRRAFGGAYRFQLLTSIQQANDWQSASESLRKALSADPTLSKDINLFYELALGNSPKGFRNHVDPQTVLHNAKLIENLLDEVFSKDQNSEGLSLIEKVTCGTAFYGIGMAVYNSGNLKASHRFFVSASKCRPSLWFSSALLGYSIKIKLGHHRLQQFRQIKKSLANITRPK